MGGDPRDVALRQALYSATPAAYQPINRDDL